MQWILKTFQATPEIENMLQEMKIELEETQSQIIRTAIVKYWRETMGHFTQENKKETMKEIERMIAIVKNRNPNSEIDKEKLLKRLCGEMGVSRQKMKEYFEEFEAMEVL